MKGKFFKVTTESKNFKSRELIINIDSIDVIDVEERTIAIRERVPFHVTVESFNKLMSCIYGRDYNAR